MQFEQFISRCLRRESHAWEELIATHREPVLRVLTRLLGTTDPGSIEDLEQKTYERLLDPKVLRGVQNPRHLMGLICKTAANLAKDRRRRMKVRRSVSLEEDRTEDADALGDPWVAPRGPEEELRRKRQLERILDALDDVLQGPNAERDRLIFHSYYVDDLGAAEIAAMGVGLSAKGVETVVFRLTKRVRERVLADEEPAA